MANIKHVRRRRQPRQVPHHLRHTYLMRPMLTGKVFVCGSNDAGQLGIEDVEEKTSPVLLESLRSKDFVDIACGGMHSVALDSEGNLYSWGCNDEQALGRAGTETVPLKIDCKGTKFVKVACGDNATLALSEQGNVYSWGTYRGDNGSFGFAEGIQHQKEPLLYPFLKDKIVIDIASGANHSLALCSNGRVYAWGYNGQGQLGRYTVPRRPKASLSCDSVGLKNVKMIGAGSYHSLAVTHDNELYAWGLNNYRQCVDVDDSFIFKPTRVPLPDHFGTIASVQGGEHFSVILTLKGDVYTFGRGDAGQLGLSKRTIDHLKVHPVGSTHSFYIPQPTQVLLSQTVTRISAGPEFVLVRTACGEVFSWGFNSGHAIGNRSDQNEPTPCLVTCSHEMFVDILQVAAGGQHSAFITENF
ncbi:hypothetical protein G6F37_004439 [Rhizopus arrhizus]|nr:hypothetical protein G6F38_000995 [Rhizopus arrhizus]KAG1159946.1 hypothetical protein G6F37_004439 [Rhizopus arrhizus]